jgi:flagellin
MSSSVVTNIASLNAQPQLYKTNLGLENTLARLISGLRINSAADDAAGLAIANRFRMDGSGLGMAAAESRIRDADMAQEAANLTKFNILNQNGLAALAPANQENPSVLSLLK